MVQVFTSWGCIKQQVSLEQRPSRIRIIDQMVHQEGSESRARTYHEGVAHNRSLYDVQIQMIAH